MKIRTHLSPCFTCSAIWLLYRCRKHNFEGRDYKWNIPVCYVYTFTKVIWAQPYLLLPRVLIQLSNINSLAKEIFLDIHQIFEQLGHENERKFWNLKNKSQANFLQVVPFLARKNTYKIILTTVPPRIQLKSSTINIMLGASHVIEKTTVLIILTYSWPNDTTQGKGVQCFEPVKSIFDSTHMLISVVHG